MERLNHERYDRRILGWSRRYNYIINNVGNLMERNNILVASLIIGIMIGIILGLYIAIWFISFMVDKWFPPNSPHNN